MDDVCFISKACVGKLSLSCLSAGVSPAGPGAVHDLQYSQCTILRVHERQPVALPTRSGTLRAAVRPPDRGVREQRRRRQLREVGNSSTGSGGGFKRAEVEGRPMATETQVQLRRRSKCPVPVQCGTRSGNRRRCCSTGNSPAAAALDPALYVILPRCRRQCTFLGWPHPGLLKVQLPPGSTAIDDHAGLPRGHTAGLE